MPDPTVSVLLTSYNKPDMLADAIQSVLAQTYRDFELIILDDNSPPAQRGAESAWSVLGDWHDHPRISIYKSDVADEDRLSQVRYAVLANVGLNLARGRFISYLCDDDLWEPQWLEAAVARLEKGDCHAVYGGQRVMVGSDLGWREIGARPATHILHVPAGHVDHSIVMHTRQAWGQAGGWETDPQWWSWADGVFFNKLAAAGYPFHPVPTPEILGTHRCHSASVTGRFERGLPPA